MSAAAAATFSVHILKKPGNLRLVGRPWIWQWFLRAAETTTERVRVLSSHERPISWNHETYLLLAASYRVSLVILSTAHEMTLSLGPYGSRPQFINEEFLIELYVEVFTKCISINTEEHATSLIFVFCFVFRPIRANGIHTRGGKGNKRRGISKTLEAVVHMLNIRLYPWISLRTIIMALNLFHFNYF